MINIIGDSKMGMSMCGLQLAKRMDDIISGSAPAVTLPMALEKIKRSDEIMLIDEAGSPACPIPADKEDSICSMI